MDNTGLPVIGANVVLKDNPGVGAITDIDGEIYVGSSGRGYVACVLYRLSGADSAGDGR